MAERRTAKMRAELESVKVEAEGLEAELRKEQEGRACDRTALQGTGDALSKAQVGLPFLTPVSQLAFFHPDHLDH
jgi:hypothetical protein